MKEDNSGIIKAILYLHHFVQKLLLPSSVPQQQPIKIFLNHFIVTSPKFSELHTFLGKYIPLTYPRSGKGMYTYPGVIG